MTSDDERDGQPGPDNGEGPAFAANDAEHSEGGISTGKESAGDVKQLDLGDEDAALPWLEGDDEDLEPGNSGQLALLVLLGLIAIAVIAGGIWWATRASRDADLVADGSVIEAPAAPYKERPKEPGGKTFEGTGDTSFVVSQGDERPAKLGEASSAPKPGFTTAGKAADASGSGAPEAKPAPAEVAGVGVQVAAYSTRASAEAGWSTLSRQYEALSGLKHRIVEGQADIGTVYRLQAVADNAAAARTLCDSLRSSGLNCQVKN